MYHSEFVRCCRIWLSEEPALRAHKCPQLVIIIGARAIINNK